MRLQGEVSALLYLIQIMAGVITSMLIGQGRAVH